MLAALAGATKALDRAVEVDPQLATVRDRFREISSIAADTAVTLSAYAAEIDADPARQAWVEERRSALSALRRRYGSSVDEVLAWLVQAKETVAEVFGDEDRLVWLGEQEVVARAELLELAGSLSAARRKAGKRFAAAVTQELQALAMPDSVLEVTVETVSDIADFGVNGADEIEFCSSRMSERARYRSARVPPVANSRGSCWPLKWSWPGSTRYLPSYLTRSTPVLAGGPRSR